MKDHFCFWIQGGYGNLEIQLYLIIQLDFLMLLWWSQVFVPTSRWLDETGTTEYEGSKE